MNDKTINYGDMEIVELRDMAIAQGLTVTGAMSKENLIELLTEKKPADLFKDNKVEAKPSKREAKEGKIKAATEERVWIEIQKTAEAMGSDDVIVGVNFKTFQIKRGVPVAVPKSVAEVLRNAVRSIYKWNETTQEKIETQVPAYPFALVVPPQ
jgi:hypothetical protein